jgi:Region found in RelA / SpoT proteins
MAAYLLPFVIVGGGFLTAIGLLHFGASAVRRVRRARRQHSALLLPVPWRASRHRKSIPPATATPPKDGGRTRPEPRATISLIIKTQHFDLLESLGTSSRKIVLAAPSGCGIPVDLVTNPPHQRNGPTPVPPLPFEDATSQLRFISALDAFTQVARELTHEAIVYGRRSSPVSDRRIATHMHLDPKAHKGLTAIRVLLGNIEQCYQAIHAIHARFKPLVSSYQDYILCPKDNGYRSLHTVVIDDLGHLVEVQVKTHQMNEQAEPSPRRL